jgi:outer membrane protein OmpA-like peptidoglycan-associated protein
MIHIRNLILSAAILLCLHATAQNFDYSTKSKKAIKAFNKAMGYYQVKDAEGAELYLLRALDYDQNFTEAWMLLGNVYEDMRKAGDAMKAYRKVVELDPGKYPRVVFNLAKIELAYGKYESALENYMLYNTHVPGGGPLKESLREGIERCKFGIEAMKNPVPFEPHNMGDSINSSNDEYFPSLTLDEKTLVITVRRPRDENTVTRTQFEEDFYISFKTTENLWTRARPAGPPLNSHGNEGAQTISANGNELFFTACERSDGFGSCDLYYSRKENKRWSRPVNMGSTVNSGRWDSQPSISPDGQTLYFSSSRDGGKGNTDLWKTTRQNGMWSKPENLGEVINTDKHEQTPFIHPDGKTLFFTSNGHLGMGGYDIFYSRLDDQGQWSTPVNLGYPINTFDDEGFMIVNPSGELAMFSSDRAGGYGGLDLYSFILYPEARPVATTYMKGTVYNSKTGEKLEARFELIDLSTSIIAASAYSEAVSGEFMVNLPSGKDYALNVSRPGFLFFSENISLTDEHTALAPLLKDIPLQPVEAGEVVVLKNIFFDFDKTELKPESRAELEKLIQLLTQNPAMVIEIGGHTDNVGNAAYNQKLSEERARSVSNYLVTGGIDKTRLSFKGYGMTKPLDSNDTEEGRARNRRTEFRVISLR